MVARAANPRAEVAHEGQDDDREEDGLNHIMTTIT